MRINIPRSGQSFLPPANTKSANRDSFEARPGDATNFGATRPASRSRQGFVDSFQTLGVDEQAFVKENTGEQVGQGTRASIFNIAARGMEHFVLRIPHIGPRPRKIEVIKKDPLFMLPEGGPIAKIGNVEILKRVPGIQAGVPGNLADQHGVEAANQIYTEKLETVAAMPQRAYNRLARKIIAVNKAGFRMDADCGTNIHLEPGKEFYLLDLCPIPKHSGYVDTLSEMVRTLTSYTYAKDAESTANMVSARKTILAKCITAAKKTKLSLPDADDWGLMNSFSLAGRDEGWSKIRPALLAAKSKQVSTKRKLSN